MLFLYSKTLTTGHLKDVFLYFDRLYFVHPNYNVPNTGMQLSQST